MNNPDLTKGRGTTNEANGDNAEDKFIINVKEKEPFPELKDSGFITCNIIAGKIGAVLSAAYKDFCGCKVIPYNNGAGFGLELYFAHSNDMYDDAPAVAFEPISINMTNNNGVVSKLNAIAQISNTMTASKIYKRTKKMEEGLSKFVPGGYNKNINWNMFVGEYTENRAGYQCTYAVVTGLDIMEFIKEIFGRKDENGKYYTYDLAVKRALPNGDFLLSLDRVSETTIKKLIETIGYVSGTGMNFVRPTM